MPLPESAPLPRHPPLRTALRNASGVALLALLSVLPATYPALAAAPAPVRIAVLDFELVDASAAAAHEKSDPATDARLMQAVTQAARQALSQSGRYTLVDTAAAAAVQVTQKTLHSCEGCDAPIALKLGADESMIGLITRVAKTEYYASLRVTDAKTGKVLNDQSAFFTGSDEAWASGVRLLIKHGVLTDPN
jgi:hypothetical protein